nr:putative reverse transcriptase domain-containing protein [Tanacetum cinerariifolium]
PKCHKCNKVGHQARDCRISGNANTSNNSRNIGANQRGNICYECGAQGHFKRECPKLKNNNRGNQGRNGNAPAKVYVVGNAGTNPDSNVVTGEAAYIFRIKITHDRPKRLIALSQSAYFNKILKKFKMINSSSVPMQERPNLSKTQGENTPNEVNHMQRVT